jgi:hypothetical protein
METEIGTCIFLAIAIFENVIEVKRRNVVAG